MTENTGLPLDALALLLTGLALLVVALVHLLLWRSFAGRVTRRWAGALLALVATDLLQVSLTQVTSMNIGRAVGITAQITAFLFFALTLTLLEHARGRSRAWIRRQNLTILVIAIVTVGFTLLTEPASGTTPGGWFRSAENPKVRAVFAVLIVLIAITAWRTAVARRGETGIRLVALGFTGAIVRPFLLGWVAGRPLGTEIAQGVVLAIFSLVVDAMLVGVGSVMMALEEERARAVARVTRVERAERMERLGLMAGSVAHDINNVLATVLAGVELARDPAATPAEVRGELDALHRAIDHGRAMTRGLLSFAKGAHRDSPLVRPGPWLLEHRDQFRFALGATHTLDITTEPGADEAIRVDATRLHQLVLNTILNSRDATPTGTACRVELSVRAVDLARERPHGVFLLRPGRWIVLRIADRGPGFPSDALDKVFEPFFSTKGERGTGLGLATVFAVARDAGGAVHAFNADEGGAVIECWFPVFRDAA